jgi:HEAT repeat protein
VDDLLSGYTLALGAVFALWFGVSLFVLVNRAIYDVRLGFVRTARRLIERRFEADGPHAERLGRTLRRLPRRTVERVAADTASEPRLAEAFAAHAVQRDRPRLFETASAHTSEAAKWRRIAALRILARARAEEALPLLELALADPDEDVVDAAVIALGGMRDEAAAGLLVQALRRNGGSRVAAQLDDFPLDVGHLLVPLLRDWEPAPRYWAAKLLSRYPDLPGLSLELATLSGDADAGVRAAVVETLGKLGGPAAISVAVDLLADPVPFVRAHAARALGGQGRPDLAALVARLLSDEEWWVRAGAKQALEALGPEATVHVLPYLESEDAFARNGAAEVLQNTGAADRLVGDLIADPSDIATRRSLRLVVEAGGEDFGAAMIARADGGGEEQLRSLLDVDEQTA